MGTRGKALIEGLGDDVPQNRVALMQIILPWCDAKESKTTFGNLPQNSNDGRHDGVRAKPTNCHGSTGEILPTSCRACTLFA